MADSLREEFKIEEKIAAIKETMARLGCSIKGEEAEEDSVMRKSSQSLDEKIEGDLLDTWESNKEWHKEQERRSPETCELAVQLASEREKVAMLGKLIGEQKATIENLQEERERMKADARVLDSRLEKVQREWESLLQKHIALELYVKELEAQRERSAAEPRIKELENQQFTLLLENAEHKQILRVKDEELALVKSALTQLREALQQKEKSISELSQTSHPRGRSEAKKPLSGNGEVLMLKSQIMRLNNELQSRPTAEECASKDKQIRLLLEEIRKLKRERGRCKSTGRLPSSHISPRHKKRCSSHDPHHLALHLVRQDTADQCSTRRLSPHKHITQELAKLLGAKDTDSVVKQCKKMLAELERLRDFAAVLEAIVRGNSPPGTFAAGPSLREIGKWVQRLVEEYLILHKSSHEEILTQLKALLQVKSSGELLRAVTRQSADFHTLSGIAKALKASLRLDPFISLEGLREVISQRFSSVALDSPLA